MVNRLQPSGGISPLGFQFMTTENSSKLLVSAKTEK